MSVPDPLVQIHWHDSPFYAGRWPTMIAGLRSLRHAPTRHAYAALAVSTGAISAERVLMLARRLGRGV